MLFLSWPYSFEISMFTYYREEKKKRRPYCGKSIQPMRLIERFGT